MQTEPPNEPPKRKRRWLQFSLRTLLVVVAIVAIPCAWLGRKIEQKRQEFAAIEAIRRSGGFVEYDSSGTSPAGPNWLRRLLGESFFSEVTDVAFYGNDPKDEVLENLKLLRQIHWLNLGAGVTDAGLASLNGLSQLRYLNLNGSRITDMGLAQIAGLKQLEVLYLQDTRVTDAGLTHLKGLAGLKELWLIPSQVTDAGVNDLQKSLPHCVILK